MHINIFCFFLLLHREYKMFTEKYKPTSLSQVLGNQISIQSLYSFLSHFEQPSIITERESKKEIKNVHNKKIKRERKKFAVTLN